MATIDKTRIPNNPIKETGSGRLVAKNGISREVVIEMSKIKNEPKFMLDMRLKSLDIYERKPIPTWGVDLSGLNLDELVLYKAPGTAKFDSWEDVPDEQKATFEKLRNPQAEREYLAGVVGVWDNNSFYEGLKDQYKDLGIHLLLDGHRRPGVPRARRALLHEALRPAAGQQVLRAARRDLVGRFVRLRPQGRQGRPSPPGLLPRRVGRRHVRAHADRRRRGLRAQLHRGLHRAELLDELDAQRRR